LLYGLLRGEYNSHPMLRINHAAESFFPTQQNNVAPHQFAF
jgi:hypothetical protein